MFIENDDNNYHYKYSAVIIFERLFVMTRLSFKVSASKYCSYKKEFNIALASLGKTFFSLNVLQIQMINFKEKEI